MIRILLAFLIFCLFSITPVFSHSEVMVVEMTADGFNPNQIEIDVNSSVIFVNHDKEIRWPASNTHPTHELYPAFDPRKAIVPGESWSFKPTKVGKWKFHDHIFPHMRATLTVVGEKSSVLPSPPSSSSSSSFTQFQNTINTFLSSIKNMLGFKNKPARQTKLPQKEYFKSLSYKTQVQKLTEIAKNTDASKSWQYVKDVFAKEAGSSGSIHDLSHFAGILLFEKKGFLGIKECSSEFAFGCYHGFLDKAFSKNLDHLLDAHDACSKLGPAGSGPVASCIHGIGHGVASYYVTADLKKSLSTCRRLITGNEYCFDGVFMEFVRSAPLSFFKKEDLLYPCDQLEEEFGYAYSFSCGRNQVSLLMGRFEMGLDEVVSVCFSSSSKPFKEACFDGLGFSVSSTGEPNQIIVGCQKIAELKYFNRCIRAAAEELVFQEVQGWYEKSKEVCAASEESQECLKNVDRIIGEYGRQVRVNFELKQPNEDISFLCDFQSRLGKGCRALFASSHKVSR